MILGASSVEEWKPTHRHVKTGGLYRVIAVGAIESTLERAVVYQGSDSQVWIRPYSEFHDGRFVEVVENVKEKRYPWIILGRQLGTAIAGEQVETSLMVQLYSFRPAANVCIPACDTLLIDYVEGEYSVFYGDQCEPQESGDLINALRNALSG